MGPDEMDDEPDEEQLKRILACKRLSEGTCQRLPGPTPINSANFICRKNSLHMIGESLAPVTEGEPMRHMSHHMSSSNMESSSSSVSSGSLRSKGGAAGKRNSSQEENTASCSSSTSLDGSGGSGGSGLRSPSRRRSSTVSQCSSVLSEGTRQQLNFDLSPDLPPDSSLLEANAISPSDFERPASPEPSSLGDSGDGSFDMRPMSRMSAFCDDIMLTASPDSTLGDSNGESSAPGDAQQDGNSGSNFSTAGQPQAAQRARNQRHEQQRQHPSETTSGDQQQQQQQQSHEANIRDNLERIISHVSTVRVSSSGPSQGGESAAAAVAAAAAAGQKRAHTPFGLNIQRNKTSHMSPATPSPTAHLEAAAAAPSCAE